MFKQQITAFIFFTLFFLALDTYVWQGIKTITPNLSSKAKSILKWTYWGYTVLVFVFFLLFRFELIHINPNLVKVISLIVFANVIEKLFCVIFLIIDDTVRLSL